jgi:hypothetical protein
LRPLKKQRLSSPALRLVGLLIGEWLSGGSHLFSRNLGPEHAFGGTV